jgi:predicted enzyme related to lactoylglutathione lyase
MIRDDSMLDDNRKADDRNCRPRLLMTVLAVRDLKKSASFYNAVFNWSIETELPVVVMYKLPGGNSLMLYQREAFATNINQMPELLPDGSISGTELYFHVDDLEGMIGRLRETGAQELSELAPRAWGDEAAYFADPDGNVLAVGRPMVDDV